MRESGSLEQQLLEYKAILEHSGIAVVCTRNRRVYRCNPRAEALFGWPAGTLVGQQDLVFHPDSAACEALREQARAALSVGEILDIEMQLARRDGSSFVAHLIARAIDTAAPGQGAVWTVLDITQEVDARKCSAQLLREQQLIFENAETGIVILRDRLIQRCNRRFAGDSRLCARRIDRAVDAHLLPERRGLAGNRAEGLRGDSRNRHLPRRDGVCSPRRHADLEPYHRQHDQPGEAR
jgi:PAS domain S-box-containing protein